MSLIFNGISMEIGKKLEIIILNQGKVKILLLDMLNKSSIFFQEPEDTIWITFFKNKLWWTQAKKGVHDLKTDKGSRIRECREKWLDTDIKGKKLFLNKISGRLSQTQGYRGTICKVIEKNYLISKINAEKLEDVLSTEKSYESLKNNLCKLIQKLIWKDFEILIDLIFTHAGWKRVSEVWR